MAHFTHQTGGRIKTGGFFAFSKRCISVPNFKSKGFVVLEISEGGCYPYAKIIRICKYKKMLEDGLLLQGLQIFV